MPCKFQCVSDQLSCWIPGNFVLPDSPNLALSSPMAIQFYATFAADDVRPYIPEGIAVLLPASSFARFCSKKTGALKPGNLPPQVTRRAADSGGYVATKKFGDYQYSQEQYTDWLFTFNPQWAAMRDYCC